MSNKVQAAVQTAYMIVSVVLAALGVTALLEYFQPTREQFIYAIMSGLAIFFVYIVYTINLSQINFHERLSGRANKN